MLRIAIIGNQLVEHYKNLLRPYCVKYYDQPVCKGSYMIGTMQIEVTYVHVITNNAFFRGRYLDHIYTDTFIPYFKHTVSSVTVISNFNNIKYQYLDNLIFFYDLFKRIDVVV